MEAPAVSVILVVRNGAATLPLALRSIASQTESRWELLAYDDGSSDNTIGILEQWASDDPRIRIFRSSESQGLGARLNKLVRAARAPLIARMDADDVSYPDRLRRQIEFLVLEGDSFRAFTVPYADGPKYLELVRDTSKPDILMAILKPVAQAEK